MTNVPFCYSEVGRDSVFERARNPAPQCVVHLPRDKSLHPQTRRKSTFNITPLATLSLWIDVMQLT